jgi:hypothetical protein
VVTQSLIRRLFTICVLSFFCLYLSLAASPGKPEQKAEASQAKNQARTIDSSQYVGSETCLACHEEEGKRFGKTPMGKAFSHPHSEAEKLGCESCHGPGKAHSEAGTKETVAVRFTKDSTNSVEEKNNSCLSCHTKGRQMFWQGSPHQSRAMACVDCHQGHPVKKETSLSADLRYNAPLSENSTTGTLPHVPPDAQGAIATVVAHAVSRRQSHMLQLPQPSRNAASEAVDPGNDE